MMTNSISPVVRLVDDDYTVLDALTVFLEMADMTVRRYSSAQAFLDEDDPDVPGVLVLDVRMPGMSGIELQAELKRRKIDQPVIFLSAHGDIEMAAEAVRAGAMSFLVKPPKPEKLLALIREAVAKSIEDRLRRFARKALGDAHAGRAAGCRDGREGTRQRSGGGSALRRRTYGPLPQGVYLSQA